jgi:hypothetical protein
LKKKKNDFQKKLVFTLFFLASFLCIEAQTSESKKEWVKDLKIGLRMQKAQKLYWENGLAIDFTSPKIANNRIHLGFSYVTTRLGSAMGTNAIKQDNFLFNLGYYFRHQKKLQPFIRANTGYFYADYESDIFDNLSNTAVLLSIDTGVSYKFNTPITINLSAGYNLNTGTGVSGPGTLYPVFYQLSVFYTVFKKS